ncbi:hypothetical protein [Weissella confusa]|uniref:hypothetical protein n=1 Tax=Weissella confusa TaxID=1583 RepID=UPI001897DF6A|nr:hypothetical protein [Weissella confusa]
MESLFEKQIGYHEWMFLDSEVEKNVGYTVAEVVKANLGNNFPWKSIQKGTSGGAHPWAVISSDPVQMSERDLVTLGGMYVAYILNGLIGPGKTVVNHSKLTEFGEAYTFATLAGMFFGMPFDVTVQNSSEFESDVSNVKELVLNKLGDFSGKSFVSSKSIFSDSISRLFEVTNMDKEFSKKAEVWAENLSESIGR